MPTTTNTLHVAGEPARRTLVHVNRDVSVLGASKVMRELGIAELLITSGADDRLIPIGILTVRDIVTRIVAAELDPDVLTAGDIAWSNPGGADACGTGAQTLASLQASNQNTFLVMHSDGRVAGILPLVDLVRALSRPVKNEAGPASF